MGQICWNRRVRVRKARFFKKTRSFFLHVIVLHHHKFSMPKIKVRVYMIVFLLNMPKTTLNFIKRKNGEFGSEKKALSKRSCFSPKVDRVFHLFAFFVVGSYINIASLIIWNRRRSQMTKNHFETIFEVISLSFFYQFLKIWRSWIFSFLLV